MNYFIRGGAANADKIKAAFKAKGISDGGNSFIHGNYLYFSEGGEVDFCGIGGHIANIIKTHPDYKELELPVEPKFKVGDWVVSPNGSQYLIAYIDKEDNRYLFEINEYTGEPMHYEDVQVVDGQYHLWSIADAKDGDVLHLGCIIAIFKKYIGQEKCICYCSISEDGDFEIPIKNGEDNVYGCTNTTPETKEQCNLLFKKMQEAGYEWDAEKRELKKIQPHYDIANFKPKQWVLVRDCDNQVWGLSMFSHRDMGCYVCINRVDFRQCIPFNDKTKHLLGTTDMPSREYINW